MRVLNVDGEARKLVLSMRQKPRSSNSEQGDVQKYADMLAEVSAYHVPVNVLVQQFYFGVVFAVFTNIHAPRRATS